jgi:hypothetical protein
MARKLRIRVDHNTCVGNAMCETFDLRYGGPGFGRIEQTH